VRERRARERRARESERERSSERGRPWTATAIAVYGRATHREKKKESERDKSEETERDRGLKNCQSERRKERKR